MKPVPYADTGAPWLACARSLLSVILALLISLTLFWSMHYLITTADRTLDESRRGHQLDFVRVKREEIVERKKTKPEKPPPAQAPPPKPPIPRLENARPEARKIAISAVPVETSIKLSAAGFNIGTSEGDYLPLVKVAPAYPRRAATRGIEGHCTVIYTVTESGAVNDVRVDEDQCTHEIFREPSLNAATRFKYKPRVINGQAIAVSGVRNRFTYKLEN